MIDSCLRGRAPGGCTILSLYEPGRPGGRERHPPRSKPGRSAVGADGGGGLDAVTKGGLTGVFSKLTKFEVSDWNEIEITVKGTEAVCKCNGEQPQFVLG